MPHSDNHDGNLTPPHTTPAMYGHPSPQPSLMISDDGDMSNPVSPVLDSEENAGRLMHGAHQGSEGYFHNPDNPGFGFSPVRTIGSAGGGGGNSTLGRAKSSRPTWASPTSTMVYDFNPRNMGTSETLVPTSMRHRSNASKDMAKGPFILDAASLNWDTLADGPSEPDDDMHDPKTGLASSRGVLTKRGLLNLGTLLLLAGGILTLFAGYPVISYYESPHASTKGAFGLGGTNATGQVGVLPSMMRTDLIDRDTPDNAKSRINTDGKTYKLVFSDEFNTNGRSFYPGDDPFWEAVDLHYWGTNNLEWYDPAAVTTKDGALHITLSQTPEHNLNFRGGMIQSWNKFCFTGGYLEVSVRMPGSTDVSGLWPAVWTMGNLGRAGYGASLEGTWPYSYDACDVGTLQNQTDVNGKPLSSATGGDTVFNRKHHTKALSFLAGQRLSACTCPQDYPELHPGPLLNDGTLKGRAAPEIDVFEAQVDTGKGKLAVSQSCQWAPYNNMYKVSNTTGPAYQLMQKSSKFNSYTGEITQQSASTVTDASQVAVQYGGDGSFATYGFEYAPGSDGYVEWISNGKPSWRLEKPFIDPDPVSQISSRIFPAEPMYIIMNLGISENFATPMWDQLADQWPEIMSIDYVRVYQPEDAYNVGCDPPDFPTSDFINRHLPAYTNANLTLWGATAAEGGYQGFWPRNRLNPNACDAQQSKQPGSPTNPKPKARAYTNDEIAAGQA